MQNHTVPLSASGPLVRIDRETNSLRTRTYTLEIVSGPDVGRTLQLDGTLMIGSHPDTGLALTDTTVSRFHLELHPRADGVRVRDLGSTNGTFIGGARVQELFVEGDAVVTVGKTALRICATDALLDASDGPSSFGRVLGTSPAMKRIFGVMERVAPSDSTVVLTGETGTGKELLAEALHQASPRKHKPLVVVDCGAIAPSLIASELFGHVKGAFTGAVSDRMGAFLEADGGTLFLDELGELPLDLQPMLLRALEAGTVKRLGENKPRRIDVRVIAATHRNLEASVKEGRFREDLYYRLAVVLIRIPPLRERLEDLPLLIRHFVTQMGRPDFQISEQMLSRFAAYPWPGNLRELRNVVERSLLGANHGPEAVLPTPAAATGASSSPRPAAELADVPFKEAKDWLVESFTREYLDTLLARCDGNISEVARVSKLTRPYVHQLMSRYGLKSGES